jgi:DNA-binding transcriptional LysR family regulator
MHPHMFDWNDLRHFLALARKGSTIAAAKSLRVSQSTVHRRIEELQARLGRHLVVRHQGGYKLTEFGVALVPFAERVEAAAVSLERFATASESGLEGTIRLTCSETIGFRLVKSRLLDHFELSNPGVKVELLMSEKFFDLAKGEADVAIRAGQPFDDSLVGRKLADHPWALFASSDYVRSHGQPETLEDIANHHVIEFEGSVADSEPGKWMNAVCKSAIVTGRSNTVIGMLMSVKSGVGIAALPIPLAISDADLQLLLRIPKITTGIYLLTHPDLRQMPRIRALFDFIVAEIETVRRVLMGEL